MVVSTEKIIKCLMGSVDDLSGYMPIRTTSTWDYGLGPLCCSLVRWLFRSQQYHGLIARIGRAGRTLVGTDEFASPASLVPCRSTKGKGPKSLCT